MDGGARIKALREDRDIARKEMEDYLGVSLRTYTDYENGRISIRLAYMIQIAQKLQVSMDYITGASNEKRPFPSERS